MQPGRLPPRVGRPGDESRGGEPRHFPFPSTCPTSAPGLGLRPRAASEPERQNHALRSPRVGKWGAGGGAGHPAGTSSPPHARPFAPPPTYTEAKTGGRESHRARAKSLALRPEQRVARPPPSWSRGLAEEGGSVLPPWPVRGLRLPSEVPASPGWQGEPRELQARPPFLLLLPLLPHVSSRSPAA